MGVIPAESFLEAIGASLAAMRTSAGLTQAQLAERAGKKQSAIARMESATPSNLALRVVFEVCQSIPVLLSDLARDAEDRCSGRQDGGQTEMLPKRWDLILGRVSKLPEKKQKELADIVWKILDMD